MHTTIALQGDIGSLLFNAVSGIVNGISAICVFLICLILSVTVIGILWGKLWNTAWNISGTRGICIASASLLAALALASAEVMDGGNFFQNDAVTKLGHSAKNTIMLPQDHAAYNFFNNLADDKEKDKANLKITSADRSNFLTTYSLLQGLFAACILGLIIGEAYFAYEDIKLIPPYGKH